MATKQTTNGQPAVYNATAPTLTDGDAVALNADINGNLQSNLYTAIAGEDIPNDVLKVENRYSYINITAVTTTLVKSGVGFLHSLIVNTAATNTSITLYDNTAASGTKIGTIQLPVTLLSDGPKSALYDVSFSVGLTIVTANAASDLTIAYR